MRRSVWIYLDKLLRDRRERLKFGSVVLLLALILVAVIWRLMEKGIL